MEENKKNDSLPNSTPLSHAEIMLQAIEAALEGRITDDYKSLKINNREITKHSFDELIRLRNYYRAEVTRIKARRCKEFQSIKVRF